MRRKLSNDGFHIFLIGQYLCIVWHLLSMAGPDDFHGPFPVVGNGFNDRQVQDVRECFRVDGHPLLVRRIHHIQRHDHGTLHLDQFDGQLQAATEHRGIHNVHNGGVPLLDDELLGFKFRFVRWNQGIRPGQVHDGIEMGPQHERTCLIGDRCPREICGQCLVTGQAVEKGAFAAIGLPRQQDLFHDIPLSIRPRKRLVFGPPPRARQPRCCH